MGACWNKLLHVFEPRTPLQVEDNIDVKLYSKTWYEIARLPFAYEPLESHSNKATYEWVHSDGENFGGYLRITNEMTLGGRVVTAKGRAHVPFWSGKNTKLRVRFEDPPSPVEADYFIILIERAQYRWVVVSEPSRQHLWILSATPSLSDYVISDILHQLVETRGFAPDELAHLIYPEQRYQLGYTTAPRPPEAATMSRIAAGPLEVADIGSFYL